VENLSAAAYLAQISRIEDASALATVLSIHSVEGRHAATVNTFLGRAAAPDGAFAKPAAADAVLTAVKPYFTG
jgi:rubrerythrin